MTNPYLDKREPVQSINIGPDDIWSYSVSYDAPRYTLATAPQPLRRGRVWRWTIDPRNLPPTITVMENQEANIAAMNAKMAHDDQTHTGPGYDDDLAAAVWEHREQMALSRDQ